MHRFSVCLPLALGLTLLVAASGWTAASDLPGILLLSSYHQGDSWNDQIVQGFRKALPSNHATVYVEQLDSRRFPDQAFEAAFAALLTQKYANTPIRVLVAADDAALTFWLRRGTTLFPGRPLVFCGINDLDTARLKSHDDVTGAQEAPDVLGTLEMGLSLLPRVTTIVAVGSTRDAGERGNLRRFRRAMQVLERRARAVELIDISPDQARKALLALPRNAVVIRLGALRPASGTRLPRGQDVALLAQVSPVPVLVLWDYDLGTGALGGRVVTATAQGRAAATITARILAGVPPQSIPIVQAPNQLELDENVLHHFGISLRRLPPGARLRNQPASAYKRHKTLFWSAGVALAVLLPASVILLLVLAGRQAAENRLRESEARYRELVECAHSLILRFDAAGRPVFINRYATKLLGYDLADLPQGLAHLRPDGPADLSGLLAQAMIDRWDREDSVEENEIQTRDGRRLVLRWDSRRLRDAAGNDTGWLAVGTDITERRRAEEALAARMLAEEELLAFGRELLRDATNALARALPHLLSAFGADKASFLENAEDPRFGAGCRLALEAASPRPEAATPPPETAFFPYSLDAFAWATALEAGETVSGLTTEFPERLQAVMHANHVQAVMAAPIVTAGVWSGFLTIGQTRAQRVFTRQEQTQLALAADMLSAHLSRKKRGEATASDSPGAER